MESLMKLLLALAVLSSCMFSAYCVDLGDACSSSDDCTATVTNSECIIPGGCTKGNCMCVKWDYAPSQTEVNKCVTSKKVGDTCDANKKTDACIPGSSCEGGTCKCRSNSFENGDKSRCEHKKFDSDCSSDHDCTTGHCTSSKCACKSPLKEKNGFCIRSIFDEVCSTDADCETSIMALTCSGGKCICKTDYNWKEGIYYSGYNWGRCIYKDIADEKLWMARESSCVPSHKWTSVAETQFCGWRLKCDKCPGSTSYTCFDGAQSVAASVLLVAMALLVSYLNI